MNRIATLCEHGHLLGHDIHCGSSNCLIPQDHEWCPGGQLAPLDARIVTTVEEAIEWIELQTDPRYVVYSEWQQGGAAIHERDLSVLALSEPSEAP